MKPEFPGIELRYEYLPNRQVVRLKCFFRYQPLSFADVVDRWRSDSSFTMIFNRKLADVPYPAYFWEMPPLTRDSAGNPFECVMVNSPELATMTADSRAFAGYFDRCRDPIAGFPNLGHDAWLIAPIPHSSSEIYPHLASFVRLGAVSQQLALWQEVGRAVSDRLSERPLWLSTSGLGVSWLHLRLDKTPKYYSWQPYKTVVN